MVYLLLLIVSISSVSYVSALPTLYETSTLLVILLLCCYRRHAIFACIVVGCLYGAWHGYCAVSSQWPDELDRQPLPIEGQVRGLVIHEGLTQRFYFEFEYQDRHYLVQLRWHNGEVRPGEIWRLNVKLKRPRGRVSPGTFDFQSYLLSQGVAASGSVVRSKFNERVGGGCADDWLGCIRTDLSQKMDESMDANYVGLAKALTLGDKTGISKEQRRILEQTGTIHLLAISGLHVGLVAVFGFQIGLFAIRLVQFLRPSFVSLGLASACSIGLALFYSLLAGFSLPTQRALIMVCVFHGAILLGRKVPVWLVWMWALLLVVVFDPLAVQSSGFWLSFGAVAVLLWCFVGYPSLPKWKGLLRAQWVIFIGLSIPSLLIFSGVSLSAPLANIIAITYVSLLVVPVLLIGLASVFWLPNAGNFLFVITATLLEWLVKFLQVINEWLPGFFYRALGEPSLLVVLIALLGAILYLSPIPLRLRLLAIPCLLPLWFPSPNRYPFAIHFLDVGQGSAVVLEINDQVYLYDTGPPYGMGNDAGEQVIAPFLRARGFNRIDGLWVSHNDSDHTGGLASLQRQFDVAQLWAGETLKGAQLCQQGQSWLLDDVSIKVLWPPALDDRSEHYLFSTPLKSNNYSCVLEIEAFGKRMLLTGDIEHRAEIALLISGHLPEKVDIFMAPHHGSKTSSGVDFLNHTQPELVVVTSGYKNRYGHPASSVTARYEQLGIEWVNTADSGTLSWVVDENENWQQSFARETRKRYWHD